MHHHPQGKRTEHSTTKREEERKQHDPKEGGEAGGGESSSIHMFSGNKEGETLDLQLVVFDFPAQSFFIPFSIFFWPLSRRALKIECPQQQESNSKQVVGSFFNFFALVVLRLSLSFFFIFP